jgi:hypothetical protein
LSTFSLLVAKVESAGSYETFVTPSTNPSGKPDLYLVRGAWFLPDNSLLRCSDSDETPFMKSRLQAFGLHFAASATALLLVLGTLYLGWYRWPGWYLTGVLHVLPIVVGVDVVLGPLLTLVIANPKKSRRELTRDIGCIVAVQLVALGYGATTLWNGRPLYYTFSERELSVTQGIDLQPQEIALARRSNPNFAPHWYSRPRWVWAPLPKDEKASRTIVESAVHGGFDVTAMPRYFKPWQEGLPELRERLTHIDGLSYYSLARQKILRERLKEHGFDPEASDVLPMTGHGAPLLAVFDLKTLEIKALLRAD